MFFALIGAVLFPATQASTPDRPIRLTPGATIARMLGPGEAREAILRLRGGESADIVVTQDGVDVVVEVFGPDGRLLDAIDSPNGRQGPEPVHLWPKTGGDYRLRVRPIAANEPRGRITIATTIRNVRETRAVLEQRTRARALAADWLRQRGAPLPDRADAAMPPLDTLAQEAAVVGLGEASHGSRELNDLRLALVRRLVERHGYRLIALEDSASRWRAIEAYVSGTADAPRGAALEWGWIGRRARRELLDWVRQWNMRHPQDRVRIVGVDAQDNAADRALLGTFLASAYGEAVSSRWAEHLPELEAADAQTAVFGDSGTSPSLRRFLLEVLAQLEADGPLLRARLGRDAFDAAYSAAMSLAVFVDFNSGEGAHSRDWYMATALLRAIEQTRAKAIYWGHNAHVSAAPTRWGPTGALLREALGCRYRAIATTFGGGGFVAQIPNDPGDRLLVTAVPQPANDEAIETALALARPGIHLSAWPCGGAQPAPPAWLAGERPMRWVGGLYAPDSAASASFQPYRLTVAFDAVAYVPTVTAEDIPSDRPPVPPRQRP